MTDRSERLRTARKRRRELDRVAIRARDEEIARLREEIRRLRAEIELLTKAPSGAPPEEWWPRVRSARVEIQMERKKQLLCSRCNYCEAYDLPREQRRLDQEYGNHWYWVTQPSQGGVDSAVLCPVCCGELEQWWAQREGQ